jgi:spore coat polysaccharide biosynthesis protein SpsF
VDVRTVAIIQARLDSQRLPEKALRTIGDRTILEWVVYRTKQIKVDEIVVATSDRETDDPIAKHCHDLGVECFRGSADDVLDRYAQAAEHYEATHILRVTADCPVLDPWLNQMILDKLVQWPMLDYVSSRGWPEGVGQEAFTFEALERAWDEATEQGDREHVVPFMIRNDNIAFIDRTDEKLSVDTDEDLKFLRSLYRDSPEMFDRVLSSS